jgi:hypothetical protein
MGDRKIKYSELDVSKRTSSRHCLWAPPRSSTLHACNNLEMTQNNCDCRRSVLPPAGYVMEDCVHRCPELDACINSSLWCDGVSHCPSGYDEAAKHCSFILRLPLLYLALGAAGILVICCSLCLIACSACRRRHSRHHRRIKSLPSEASTIGKEVICWHSDNSVRYVEVDRVTTVWQWHTSALCSMAA